MKKAIFRLVVLAIVAAGGWGGYSYFKQSQTKQATVPTTRVQRSDVVIRAFTRGEMKTVRTYPLYAPNLNGTVQVTQLAPMGSFAKEKELIVEYDDSELLAAVDEENLSLQSTDESIKAQRLRMQIMQSQDKVDLLKAQFAVKRAELEVKRNDVVDAIQARKNLLRLEQAKRALVQAQIDIDMRQAQADSQLVVLNNNRRRGATELQRDMARLRTTKTLAPLSGLVAIKQNRGGSFNFGQQMPDIRAGDTLQAGMNVADLLDLSEMELSAKVGELDRANLNEGQAAMIQLDSIPDKRFPARIKNLSGTAVADVFSGDPSKKFDVVFAVDMRALLTGLDMKPAEIERIMNTAAENAKKNLVSFAPTGGGGRGGPGGPGGGFMGGPPGAGDVATLGIPTGGRAPAAPAGGQEQGATARGASGAPGQAAPARGASMANISDEDRQKLSDLRQKMQSAEGEERNKLSQELQALQQKLGISRGGRGGATPGAQADSAAQGRGAPAEGGDQRQSGAQAQNGGASGRASGGQGQNASGGTNFSDADLQNAKLPLPPEEDSAVGVLLRPGLLADVEVEIEKIPNALHVPTQAVFQKNGKPTLFVKQADGKFVAREVQVLKQSESTMVLSGGVKEGEVIAMADPTANKSDKKGKTEEKKSSSTTGMPMPGGN